MSKPEEFPAGTDRRPGENKWDNVERALHPDENHATSRSIKADPSHRHRPTMKFPMAMDALLAGERIARTAWPLGDFVTITKIPTFQMGFAENRHLISAVAHVHDVQLGRQILKRTAAWNAWAPWLPSNEEIFETDWIYL